MVSDFPEKAYSNLNASAILVIADLQLSSLKLTNIGVVSSQVASAHPGSFTFAAPITRAKISAAVPK
ncbi:hypothetical protein D9M68_367440 [compost metagenome]